MRGVGASVGAWSIFEVPAQFEDGVLAVESGLELACRNYRLISTCATNFHGETCSCLFGVQKHKTEAQNLDAKIKFEWQNLSTQHQQVHRLSMQP